MEAIYVLGKFFPSGTSDDVLNKYLTHHLTSATSCAESEMYSSAYSHLHLLYMTFVYIQLMRIARERQKEFRYSWIGFSREESSFLKKPTSPFSFSHVSEKTVFRFFRLVGFDDQSIGDISQLVKIRNERLHAKGQLHCELVEDFERELSMYVSKMDQIIEKQKTFLDEIYIDLLETYDEEYIFSQDDLENNYIDQYLFSERELVKLASDKDDKVSVFIRSNYDLV